MNKMLLVDGFRNIIVRRSNDMHGEKLANPACSLGCSVHSGLHRTNITLEVNGDQTAVHGGILDDLHIGRLHRRVGSLDSSDEAHRLDHPYGLLSHLTSSARTVVTPPFLLEAWLPAA